MRWLLDLLYLAAATFTAPVWLTRMIRTGKIRTDWPGRFGRIRAELAETAANSPPRVLIHAVSVGEVNAVRQLVELLQADLDVVVATTTDTGFDRATKLWGTRAGANRGRIWVVRYPFDFSIAVGRFLNSVQPRAVALTELEVWPNFVAACAARGVPVCVVNGRLTERSFKRYRLIRWLMRPAFAKLAFAAVQNEPYSARFRGMGVPADRVHITGTMKWDTAQIANHVDGAEQLARDMGIDRTRPLIVAGSTAPGEHELLHAATPPGVQLLCAPRKPEWFDHAAAALPGCIRRTRTRQAVAAADNPESQISNSKSQISNLESAAPDRFLLDTIGELRMAYALADLIVIGRSFGNLHGSDMMEPAALGKAVIVGPAVRDFQDTVDALLAGDGIVQTTADQLQHVIVNILSDPHRRAQLASNARRIIEQNQGATARHAALIRQMIGHASSM